MKVLCLHHTDLDGAGSASVVGLYHHEDEVTYRMYNYGWPLSPEELQGYDLIYAVDISFFQGGYDWVYKTPNLIWIDHHLGAIRKESLPKYSWIKNIPGLRRIGQGACELTWEYLFPEYQCPDLIQILGTYDVWDKTRMNWVMVNEIEAGAKHVLGVNPKAIIDFIQSGKDPQELQDIGKTILGYIEKSGKGKLMSGFWIPDFHGLRVMALCTTEFSSLSFISYYNPVLMDICMPFQVVPSEGNPGEFFVRCSLYTENPEIDVSKIAEKFGGSGHRGAAGMQISLTTLSEILKTGESLKDYFRKIGYRGNQPTYY